MRRLIFCVFILCGLCLGLALGEEAQDITAKCTITASNGGLYNALDGSLKTYWKAESGSQIIIELPENVTPGGVLVEWFEETDAYTYALYDANKSLIEKRTNEDYFVCLNQYVTLTEDTRYLKIMPGRGDRISRLHVYGAGTLPGSVQVWQPPVQKADLMLISTHQDDEELWFGGTIPYYAVQRGDSLIVVYMASCGRIRRGEALDGLWAMGVVNYPEFLMLKDENSKSYEAAVRTWGGENAILNVLTDVIRKYKPEVIVTHDLKGEYGHPQHMVVARHIKGAVEAAADAKRFPNSASLYGAWDVKKLYLHLGSENVIYMDWETPATELDGKTPIEVAGIGFSKHETQQQFYSMEQGKIYDNTKFSLVYSTVGSDVYKDDMLENTIADPRLKPTPTPTPTIKPTPEPTPPPTIEPTPEPKKQEKTSKAGRLWIYAGIGLAAGLAYNVSLKKKNRRRGKKKKGKAKTR